ncbi:MAG: hypothetical protein FWC02_01355 [Firmicutes bacterium]|nr:hypothetical protein [Bacillota bacterium]
MDKNIKICPFMSTERVEISCAANCALNIDGECAFLLQAINTLALNKAITKHLNDEKASKEFSHL